MAFVIHIIFSILEKIHIFKLKTGHKKSACTDNIPRPKRNSRTDIAHYRININPAAIKDLRHICHVINCSLKINSYKLLIRIIRIEICWKMPCKLVKYLHPLYISEFEA